MDEAKFFAGLCFGASKSALQALACCESEDEVYRYLKPLPREIADWGVAFVRRFRANARRVKLEPAKDLASASLARQAILKVRSQDSGYFAKDVTNAVEFALRVDELADAEEHQPELRDLVHLVSDLRSETSRLFQSVDEIRARLATPTTRQAEPEQPAHLLLIEILDYALSLQLLEWTDSDCGASDPVAIRLVPGDPAAPGINIIRLIVEKFLSALALMDVAVIDVEVGRTVADARHHNVVEVRDTPLGYEGLAGTVFKIIRHGFRRHDGIVRQPTVVAYKRGVRQR